ncbi:MAG: anti-sigma F factor [Firmicutes bacterium]|nr:anti-sigma F factor [Bacillota bacterium]
MLEPNNVRMEFPSRPENVAFARTAVAMFAAQMDFTLDEIDEIKIATSEAVSNAVIHGYKDRVGIVKVTVALYDDYLEIRVEDEGVGIEDIQRAMEPAFTTDPTQRMGLGMVFMKEYMDKLDIRSEVNKGTEVIMQKSPSAGNRETAE